MGKNVLTDILHFFSFVLKSGWLFACDPTLLRKYMFYDIFGRFVFYFQKLTYAIMLGHMQKLFTFEHKIKKNPNVS